MTTAAIKTYGVTLDNTALAFSTNGVNPGKWLQNFAAGAWDAIKRGVQSALDLGKKMFEGGKEVIKAISSGNLGIFLDWFKEDPKAAIAGGVAVGIAGWFVASGTGIGGALAGATSVASLAIGSMWATITSIKFGGIALGAMLPTLTQAIVGGSRIVSNIDFLASDASLLAALNAQYITFLGRLGEGTGRLIAGLLFGGGRGNPKLTINITAAASVSIIAEQEGGQIQEEMIEELSALTNVFIRYAANLMGKLGYISFRKWARNNVRTGIDGIDKHIKEWGLKEGESFTIASSIQKKIDNLEDKNPELHAFVEGAWEGLGEGISDFVAFV